MKQRNILWQVQKQGQTSFAVEDSKDAWTYKIILKALMCAQILTQTCNWEVFKSTSCCCWNSWNLSFSSSSFFFISSISLVCWANLTCRNGDPAKFAEVCLAGNQRSTEEYTIPILLHCCVPSLGFPCSPLPFSSILLPCLLFVVPVGSGISKCHILPSWIHLWVMRGTWHIGRVATQTWCPFWRIEIFQFFVDLDNVNNILKLHHEVWCAHNFELQCNILKNALDGTATRPVCQVPESYILVCFVRLMYRPTWLFCNNSWNQSFSSSIRLPISSFISFFCCARTIWKAECRELQNTYSGENTIRQDAFKTQKTYSIILVQLLKFHSVFFSFPLQFFPQGLQRRITCECLSLYLSLGEMSHVVIYSKFITGFFI